MAKFIAKRHDTLEDAIYSLVHEGALPPKALASAIGVGYSYLLSAANPHSDDVSFQTRIVAPATNAQRNDSVIRFLAEACGGLFVRLDARAANDELTARSLKEFGDYLHQVAARTSDGAVSAEDVMAIRLEAHEAIAALLAHVAALETRVAPVAKGGTYGRN